LHLFRTGRNSKIHCSETALAYNSLQVFCSLHQFVSFSAIVAATTG
jgi:hypothetical protein